MNKPLLKKTSTWINQQLHTELQSLLKEYDISLREFIEYSFLYMKDDRALQGHVLIESRYKKINKGENDDRLD